MSCQHRALLVMHAVMGSHEAKPKPTKFICTRCGNCCRGEGHVYLTQEDVKRISESLGLSRETFLKTYTYRHHRRPVLRNKPNMDCIFLENSLCAVHDVKPRQCTKWPFWKTVATDPASFSMAKSYCEGLKQFGFEDFKKVAEREDLLPRP